MARTGLSIIRQARRDMCRGFAPRRTYVDSVKSMRNSINTALRNDGLSYGQRNVFQQLKNMSDTQLADFMERNPDAFDVFFDYP